MTGISMLHNLSMSVGCALLAATDSSLLIYFVGGNVVVFLVFKVARNDFLYWIRVKGAAGVAISFMFRVVVKVIVDFTGLVQMRHPYELGGAWFTASVVWAQILPFVALEFFFEGEKKEEVRERSEAKRNGEMAKWLLTATSTTTNPHICSARRSSGQC